jgi:hypothetical protein
VPQLTRDWSVVKKVDPELWSTVNRIEEFLKSIPSMQHVDPRRLAHRYGMQTPQVLDLCRTLEIARAKGLVKRSWAVLSPTGVQAIGHWDKISSIPSVLYDTGGGPTAPSSRSTDILTRRIPMIAADFFAVGDDIRQAIREYVDRKLKWEATALPDPKLLKALEEVWPGCGEDILAASTRIGEERRARERAELERKLRLEKVKAAMFWAWNWPHA